MHVSYYSDTEMIDIDAKWPWARCLGTDENTSKFFSSILFWWPLQVCLLARSNLAKCNFGSLLVAATNLNRWNLCVNAIHLISFFFLLLMWDLKLNFNHTLIFKGYICELRMFRKFIANFTRFGDRQELSSTWIRL